MECLCFQSKQPKIMLNKISDNFEQKIVQVRLKTGFGSDPISVLLNESFRYEEKQ